MLIKHKIVTQYQIQRKITNDVKKQSATTDPFAIISFSAGLGGFLIIPIIFVPIGYIAAIVSYYRLKEDENLKGNGLRIIGAILTTINIFWLMYQFKVGFFRN